MSEKDKWKLVVCMILAAAVSIGLQFIGLSPGIPQPGF